MNHRCMIHYVMLDKELFPLCSRYIGSNLYYGLLRKLTGLCYVDFEVHVEGLQSVHWLHPNHVEVFSSSHSPLLFPLRPHRQLSLMSADEYSISRPKNIMLKNVFSAMKPPWSHHEGLETCSLYWSAVRLSSSAWRFASLIFFSLLRSILLRSYRFLK